MLSNHMQRGIKLSEKMVGRLLGDDQKRRVLLTCIHATLDTGHWTLDVEAEVASEGSWAVRLVGI